MAAFGRFLKKIIIWTLTVAATALAAIFAVNNRGTVTLDFSPLGLAIDIPAYALFFAGIVLGAMLAALIGGYSLVRTRRRLARVSREAKEATRQLEHVRSRGAEMEARLREAESARQNATEHERYQAGAAGLPAVYSRETE